MINKIRPIFAAILMSISLAAVVGAAQRPPDAPPAPPHPPPTGHTQTKSFNVNKGGTLEVSLGVGDIVISSWEKNQVFVTAQGIDPDDAGNLKMTQTGDIVRVSYRPEWDSHGRTRFTINVPVQFNTDLSTAGGDIQLQGVFRGTLEGSTSGGDIRLGNVDGNANMHTSGGDIIAGRINGRVELHTSGGDIRVDTSSGEVQLGTSGGDIRIGNVGKTLVAKTSGGDIIIGDVGGSAEVSTAGGDIQVGKVSGSATLRTAGGDIELAGGNGQIKAKTAGGDVNLRNITGSVEAQTAGGDVIAELRPSGSGQSRLSSAGGDLFLYLPENSRATISALVDIRGRWMDMQDTYEIISDFKSKTFEKDADTKEIRATYVLNGGGENITLETVNGNIEIRRKP